MGLNIEQKIEGCKKKIIIKKKINVIEIAFFLLIFSLVFNPFYQAYLDNPDQFSTGDIYFLIFIAATIIFFCSLQYLSRMFIIKDLSNGTIDLQKKIFKTKSYIFCKDERTVLELSKIFMIPLLMKQRYVISMKSGMKSVAMNMNPDFTLQLFGSKIERIFSKRNSQWLFTKEDAEIIARFLEIPLLTEGDDVRQVAGQNIE